MTNQIRAPRESWLLTTSSESRPTANSAVGGAPLFATSPKRLLSIVDVIQDIDAPTPPGFEDIDDLVTRAESDLERAAAIADARRNLGNSDYSEPNKSIAAYRLRHGWSQRDLALAMGTSQPHIARIESGSEDLRISTITKLAAALEISLADAFVAVADSFTQTP